MRCTTAESTALNGGYELELVSLEIESGAGLEEE